MGQERLVGLGLLNVHRELEISEENIIRRLANLKNKNLEFVI